MKQKQNRLPDSFRKYFWDVDFESLDIRRSKRFIIKRVIDRGDTQALSWILSKVSLNDVRDIVVTSRDLSRRTANFWAFILNLDSKNVPCLQKPYSRTPFGPSI